MSLDIMVLDDSSVMRKIVLRTLRQSGLAIGTALEASSGDEGLALLKEGHRPKLILSDVNMAGMDGITFVREAREILPPSDTKIVMITTESGEDKVKEAMTAGANGYLTKPFTPDQVADSLKSLSLG